jgi:YggT family protein
MREEEVAQHLFFSKAELFLLPLLIFVLCNPQLCRIVLSWYPTANVNELPFNLIVWPTEPLLRLVRGSVPPAFGVDITPVVWLGLFSFMNEILLGQQGLLTMKIKYGI